MPFQKKNKLLADKFMLFSVAWSILFSLIGVFTHHLYLVSLALMPLALYELIRTQGIRNTKPLSLATLVVLVLQFLHDSTLFLFPFDLTPLINLLPITLPPSVDPVILLSILLLGFFSLSLIKYTWGSITKLLAILLLLGTAVQVYMYWSHISSLIKDPYVQDLIDSRQQDIKDNLRYRLERELNL
jgi:hypothetical protein